jgi:uncharacterized protein with von Willebrand factor type A (vWA) domain
MWSRLRSGKKLALMLTLASSPALLEAQNNRCLQRTVLVSALENRGRQVSGLETDGFEARIGKQQIQIAPMTPAPANRRAVLLLDVSGSMAGDRVHEKWSTAIAIANQALSNAPASLSLGMIAFSDKLLERVDFGPRARNEIASRLQKYAGMRPAGGTALLDTIDRAIGMLTPSHVADAIYVISDAGDNYSKGTIDRVRTRLLVSGVRLHLIYIRENAIAFFGVWRLGT